MKIHVMSVHEYSLSDYDGLASFGSLQVCQCSRARGSRLTMEDICVVKIRMKLKTAKCDFGCYLICLGDLDPENDLS